MGNQSVTFVIGFILLAGCCGPGNAGSPASRYDSESVKEALHVPVLLTWIEHPTVNGNPNQTEFFLDGRVEGKGVPGFAKVLRDIDQYHDDRAVVEAYHAGLYCPSGPPYETPVERFRNGMDDQIYLRVVEGGLDFYPVEFYP